jgi:putative flippase GtrA
VFRELWRDQEKLRFVVVGAWNTVFAYLAFSGLYVLLHRQLHYLLIGALAHVLAVINAFICQRSLVFRSRTHWLAAFLRFNAVQLLVMCLGLVGLAVLVEGFHIHPLLSQLLLIAIAVVVTYVLNRTYAFRV